MASRLGVDNDTDGWLEETMTLLLKQHARCPGMDFTGLTAGDDGSEWSGTPASGSEDAAQIRAIMSEEGLASEVVSDLTWSLTR